MAGLDKEWEEAIDEEYGDDVAEDIDDTQEEDDEDTSADDVQVDAPTDEDDSDDTPEEPEADEGDDKEDAAEEDPQDDPTPPPAPEPDPTPPAPQASEDIKRALLELERDRQAQESGLNTMKDEVLNTLYPEGVDRQLRDADGDPINGLQDLTGVDPQTGRQVGAGLINPVTGEVFTEEEAGRFILRGQQELNEQVEKMENQAYQIAEVQYNLKESSERVEKEFGPILDRLPPEIGTRIMDAYIATLQRDPQSGIVVGAPLDAYEFFSIALAGARPLLNAQPPTPPKQPAAKTPSSNNKGDRADLGQRGTPEKMSSEDREWEEAFNEVL